MWNDTKVNIFLYQLENEVEQGVLYVYVFRFKRGLAYPRKKKDY